VTLTGSKEEVTGQLTCNCEHAQLISGISRLISLHMLHLNQKASSLFAFDFGGDDLCRYWFNSGAKSFLYSVSEVSIHARNCCFLVFSTC
jgi:hypothetical protein